MQSDMERGPNASPKGARPEGRWGVKTSDIPDVPILEYLYERQGQWTCLWYGSLKDSDDVYFAMPPGLPPKLYLSKMKSLVKRGLVGGCDCGCRGDFEITDKGLQALGKPRLKKYTGY